MTVTTLLNGSSVGLIHDCVEHTFFENAEAIIASTIHELADQLFKTNERVRFEHIFPVELKGDDYHDEHEYAQLRSHFHHLLLH